MRETGAAVIEHGLPELPEQLTHQMRIPFCSWSAGCCAVVAFMQFSPGQQPGRMEASALKMPYFRQDGRWVPVPRQGFLALSLGFDPVAGPDYGRRLDGSTITYCQFSHGDSHEPGQPASTVLGFASPDVKYLAVTQDGQQDYRPLQSHFGAYLVCVEKPGPFDVAAFDSDGQLLETLAYPLPGYRRLAA
jgi:hypothetical protein